MVVIVVLRANLIQLFSKATWQYVFKDDLFHVNDDMYRVKYNFSRNTSLLLDFFFKA